MTRLEKQFALSHALLWLGYVNDRIGGMGHPSLAQYRAPLEARRVEMLKYVRGLADELGIDPPAGELMPDIVLPLLQEWYLAELTA